MAAPGAPAGAAALPLPLPQRRPRPVVALFQLCLAEAGRHLAAEEERWFLWCVAAFAGGIASYFGLREEPSLGVAAVVALAAIGLAIAARKSPAATGRFLCAMLAAQGFGFAAAKVRAESVAAPIIARDIGPLTVVGRVEDVDIRAPNKARIVLAPMKLGDRRQAMPRRVRLTLTGENAVKAAAPGAILSALAVLRPPPEPVLPGGYDFARSAYFEGIGGVGFTYGAPKRVEEAPPPALIDRLRAGVQRLRLRMASRVEQAIAGPDGRIAAALITGERGGIEDEDAQAYRDSGLAHVLSISGLHLALAGLGVFWLARALLALIPSLALKRPIKKWAAFLAFASATFYLIISGGGSPAVRSWLMLSALLLAILADRPALSMRAVALSALAILMVTPEEVINPSFQMSFAAVIGLIALAELGASRQREPLFGRSRGQRIVALSARYLKAMVCASLIATLATTPFAIYHFDRAAAYSLLANLIAEPVVAFVIMPSAAVAVLLMPLGLDLVPLKLMGWGVHRMTAIAHGVASLPGAATVVRSWPVAALGVLVFGGLWIALWRLRWRWLGVVPVAMGLGAIFFSMPPDILVARDGQSVAVRTGEGRLAILGSSLDAYTAEQWLLRDGDKRNVEAARHDAHCDEFGCTAIARDGRTVALSLKTAALIEDCARADIVIAAVPVRVPCRRPDLVLDRFATLRSGALALSLDGRQIDISAVNEERGSRPWTRRSGRERPPSR